MGDKLKKIWWRFIVFQCFALSEALEPDYQRANKKTPMERRTYLSRRLFGDESGFREGLKWISLIVN